MAPVPSSTVSWVKASLAIIFIILISGILWFYRSQEKLMEQKVEDDLTGIAQLKINQIHEWRTDQIEDATSLQRHSFLIERIERFLADPKSDTGQALRTSLQSIAEQHGCDDILLVDRKGGILFGLTGNEHHGGFVPYLAASFQDRKPVLTDLHLEPDGIQPHISTVVPLFSLAEMQGKPLGALVLIHRAGTYLFPLVNMWPTASTTAETLLVKRDGDHVLFLSELRHQANTALKLRIPLARAEVPAVMAILGKQGFCSGKDYRGVEVVAVIKPVPDSPWFMIAKIDTEEAYSVWRFQSTLMLSMLLGIVASAGLVGLLFWQRQEKTYFKALYDSEAEQLRIAARHSITLQAIGDAVIVTDKDGRVELLNPVAESLTGWHNEDARGKPLEQVFRIVNGQTRQVVENPVTRVLLEGTVVGLANHTILIGRDGFERPIADSGAPIRDVDNGITGVVLVFRDQTVEYQAQKALLEREQLFRSTFEQGAVGFAHVSTQGCWLRVNAKLCEITGYSPEELLGRPFLDITHPEDRNTDLVLMQQLLEGTVQNHTLEKRYIRRNGDIIWININVSLVRTAEGEPDYFITVIQDISRQKKDAEKLFESTSRLETALASMTDAVFISDNAGRLVQINDAFVTFHRFREKDDCLRTVADLPDIFDAYTEDGTLAPPEMWAVPRALRGETAANVIYSLHRKDTGETWIGSYSFAPIRNPQGEIAGSVVVARDITEQKKNEDEQARLGMQVQQLQKMEAIGQLAGGVAHDFNNMLGVILGHAELAMEDIDPDSRLSEDLREIRKAARRSADITRQLLAFARKQEITPREIDLNDTVEGMLKMLRRLIGEDIELSWVPGFNVWPVLVDPSQIDQILANLCVNARDAIDGGGRITVETENHAFSEEYCADHPEVLPGDYVMIAVSDTGRGMDQETLSRIFEPFFTTKGPGEGTGLGLATVYGAVKQNEGFINVYSEPGQGTVFRIYLPRCRASSEHVAAKEVVASVEGGNETILLVEDERAILRMTATMLQGLGYSVIAANSAQRALQAAQESASPIDLLLSDIIMPQMNGWDLANALAPFQPTMRWLFMSGYTANVISRQGAITEGLHFIQKPFSKNDLAAKIREALEG